MLKSPATWSGQLTIPSALPALRITLATRPLPRLLVRVVYVDHSPPSVREADSVHGGWAGCW